MKVLMADMWYHDFSKMYQPINLIGHNLVVQDARQLNNFIIISKDIFVNERYTEFFDKSYKSAIYIRQNE